MKCTNGKVTFNIDFSKYSRTPLRGRGEKFQEEAFYWIAYQEIQDTRAWNVKAFWEAKFFKQTLNVNDVKSLKPSNSRKNSWRSWGRKKKKRTKTLQNRPGPSSYPGSEVERHLAGKIRFAICLVLSLPKSNTADFISDPFCIGVRSWHPASMVTARQTRML